MNATHHLYVDQVRRSVLNWLESIRCKDGPWGRWPYHAAMERPFALISSAWAIKLLDALGELPRVPASRREEAAAWLQSTQDPGDGHFKDPLVTEADREGSHSWEDIYGQMGVAAEALEHLDAAPLHPLPKMFAADPMVLGGAAYTRSFDWSRPWHRGEAWARGLIACVERIPTDKLNPLPREVTEALATLEAEVLDPATGTPSMQMPRPVNASVAMAGLFKVMVGYLRIGVSIPNPERGIGSTLALQHADGEFGFRNNMCINWDALWVLRELNRQLDGGYRSADIQDAGNRCADMLLTKYRRTDGAFSFKGAVCTANHHSIRLCRTPEPVGDMMGTIMVMRCLAYADE
ncbi:MAG: hypothetical protein R6V03_06650 [Kiritimatiellia bacterium]